MTTWNVAGNYYDKYHTGNPIAQWLMNGFLRAFDDLVGRSEAQTVYEAGCGEGHLSIRLARRGLCVAGGDIDSEVVKQAIQNAQAAKVDVAFGVGSVYDLQSKISGQRDLIVCCEVLEHLEEPERAIDILAALEVRYVLVSVPREPIWRLLNMARGQYLSAIGNTPGHLQHWSSQSFLDILHRRLDIVAVRRPLPWTMALCKLRQ
jgi:2-polyprenyl-3-methyl-5-hydroxy-6-metoxy-1,4-benzoquinol methylase